MNFADKKIFLIFSISILFLITGCSSYNGKIISSTPCQNGELYECAKNKGEISYEQSLNDLNYFTYLLETAYSGYSEIVENGFNKEEFIKNVTDDFKNQISQDNDKIETRYESRIFQKYLYPFVNDNHLAIMSYFETNNFIKRPSPYYTDVYVQKVENKYYVASTVQGGPKINQKYTGKLENLFYYPSKGGNIYRVGLLSENVISNYDFEFDGKLFNISVKNDGYITPILSSPFKFTKSCTNLSSYFFVSNFWIPENDSAYKKGWQIQINNFMNNGIESRNKKNIILDFRSTFGGDNTSIIAFLLGLYNNNFKKITKKEIKKAASSYNNYNQFTLTFSPVLAKKIEANKMLLSDETLNYKRFFKKMIKNQYSNPQKIICTRPQLKNYYKPKNKTFTGKIIILNDRNTCSTSLLATEFARQLFGDQVIVIGENAPDAIIYAPVQSFSLPESKLDVDLPYGKVHTYENDPLWDKTNGLLPDAWCDSKDIIETLFYYTEDSEIRQFFGKLCTENM